MCLQEALKTVILVDPHEAADTDKTLQEQFIEGGETESLNSQLWMLASQPSEYSRTCRNKPSPLCYQLTSLVGPSLLSPCHAMSASDYPYQWDTLHSSAGYQVAGIHCPEGCIYGLLELKRSYSSSRYLADHHCH